VVVQCVRGLRDESCGGLGCVCEWPGFEIWEDSKCVEVQRERDLGGEDRQV
jgi:hypothetical protein